MNYKKFSGAASAALMIVIVTLILTTAAGAASKYKTLYEFKNGKDGGTLVAPVIFDQAGNLYGTAAAGGITNCYGSGCGVVFKLTPNSDGSWTESVLYSFTGGNDGGYPSGPLIFDQAGNLYGMTYWGGANHYGVVFELKPNTDGSWTESVPYSFCSLANCSDGRQPYAGLIFDNAGNLYGTTMSGGGPYDDGTAFKLTPSSDGSWKESVLHSFANGVDGQYPGNLTFDALGNLYGTTWFGGRKDRGVVFQLTPNTDGSWKANVLHNFTGGKDGGLPRGSSLIFDQAGNLYGTTSQGDGSGCDEGYGCGVVFKLTPTADGSWKEKVLHRFSGSKGGAVPRGGLILDPVGNLYGTTSEGGNLSYCYATGCGVVFKLAPNSSGGWRETVLHSFRGQPGIIPLAGVIFDAAGNLYGTTAGDIWNGQPTSFGSVFEITP
jgi:uncharacterized repeat protein (TIGR03803 family)